MIKIEKNIPIPDVLRKSPHAYSVKYPLRDLEVGDSIFVEGKMSYEMGATVKYHSINGKKFTARTINDEKEGVGTRIWRTA